MTTLVSPRMASAGVAFQTALAQGLQRAARTGRSILVSHAERIEPVDPVALFARARAAGLDCSLWRQPSEAFALVGVGEAAVLGGSGRERFRQVSEGWSALLRDALVGGESERGVGPILLGGFAFDPERPATPEWDGFPDARLVLPRLMLTVSPAGSWLTVNQVVTQESDVERVAREITLDRQSLFDGECCTTRARRCVCRVVEARDADDWRATVARAIRQIRCGLMEKVVLARAVRLEADGTLDVPAALTRLSETYPSCTVFAIARRERTFMGATPERLVRLEQGQLQAACLAGSSRRGANLEEDLRLGWDLLTSDKDLGEHAVVVRVLTEALGGLCERMNVPKQPRLLTVANIHHLFTPVCGVLAQGKTILDAVEGLHPTPAVGGAPCEPALRFIRECEELDRGWYAAPVGWLDGQGEGEFAVALRSALIDERQATLFAGCGVVLDSDLGQEYAESRVKLHAMLAALTGHAR